MELLRKAETKESENKVFAKGYCFAKIFLFFVVGCVVGTYYEQLLEFFKFNVWVRRSGLIYGPFNPVYGLGAISFVVLLGKNYKKRKWVANYSLSCLIGGAIEYLLSLAQEYIFHSKSWSYGKAVLNIGGRTTVPFMLVWGIGGMLVMYVIYPIFSKIIEEIPYQPAKLLYTGLLIFMSFNIVISGTALLRQRERLEGKAADTFLDRVCDTVYDDQFLKKAYPNYKILEFEDQE